MGKMKTVRSRRGSGVLISTRNSADAGKKNIGTTPNNAAAALEAGVDFFKIPDFGKQMFGIGKNSTVTGTALPTLDVPKIGPGMGKKTKRELRHNRFLQKLKNHRVELDEAKKEKLHNKKAFLGDLAAINAALPNPFTTLPVFDDQKKKATTTKTRGVTSRKGRHNAMIREALQFQNVLQHTTFQSSPADTILEHIKNSLNAEKGSK